MWYTRTLSYDNYNSRKFHIDKTNNLFYTYKNIIFKAKKRNSRYFEDFRESLVGEKRYRKNVELALEQPTEHNSR